VFATARSRRSSEPVRFTRHAAEELLNSLRALLSPGADARTDRGRSVLRVALTGDYASISAEHDGGLRGVDVGARS